MKMRTFLTDLFASLGAGSLLLLSATAQTSPPTTATPAPAASASTPVKLPYGAEDVLKLSRAQVGEEVTLNFIRNSGTIYNLAPKDIVYLRNEGVSDRVINTMLDQRKNVPAEAATQAALANTAPAPSAPVSSGAIAAPARQYAPTYVQQAPVYVQPQPISAPASTLHVIPYPYSGYRYPGWNPYYYGSYYRYGGPSVVLGFGYCGGGYWGAPCRGYYGGGYYGFYRHR